MTRWDGTVDASDAAALLGQLVVTVCMVVLAIGEDGAGLRLILVVMGVLSGSVAVLLTVRLIQAGRAVRNPGIGAPSADEREYRL